MTILKIHTYNENISLLDELLQVYKYLRATVCNNDFSAGRVSLEFALILRCVYLIQFIDVFEARSFISRPIFPFFSPFLFNR